MNMSDLYRQIADDEIEILNADLPKTKSVAILDEDNDRWIVIDYKRVKCPADELIRLCHEKNHHELGLYYDHASILETRSRYETRVQRRTIRELLSPEMLEAAYASGCTELWQMAEFVGMPEPFVREAIEYYRAAQV